MHLTLVDSITLILAFFTSYTISHGFPHINFSIHIWQASSTRVRGSTSQQQPPLEIQLYETPAHEESAKILEERRALHERTIKFLKGKDTFEERILARVWEFMKIEERKLADQETEFGSKTEQGSTHMRGIARICVLLIPQPTP
ncbi:hypothetical protein PIB30_097979, partial [Stylosanthes scabra]|nr:hypothetical protein [Stylosanthes scabra]